MKSILVLGLALLALLASQLGLANDLPDENASLEASFDDNDSVSFAARRRPSGGGKAVNCAQCLGQYSASDCEPVCRPRR